MPVTLDLVRRLDDRIKLGISKINLLFGFVNEQTIEDVVQNAFTYSGVGRYNSIQPAQVLEELVQLLRTLEKYEINTVMEIGSHNGGTLYCWSRAIDDVNRILCLNLPEVSEYKKRRFGSGINNQDVEFYKSFNSDVDIEFVLGNSHSANIHSEIEAQLGGRKLDYLFIDGDHSYDGVKKDFLMYSPFVKNGGIIAFHDINHPSSNIEVSKFWNEIKSEYTTYEIICHKTTQTIGDGTVFGAGIGLIFI